MNVKAYLMIKVSAGKEREAFEKIKQFINVIENCVVYGEYDLIVKLLTKDLVELDFLTEEIRRSIPEIILTLTAIVAREYKGKRWRTL